MYQIALSKYSVENGIIPKLIKKNGPPQCGIYTLGQQSKLYVLIRLEETNNNRSQERILLFLIDHYFFSLITVFNNILTVLFDTFTNNVSFLYLFLFLIEHLFKCVALLCIYIIVIVLLLIYTQDFHSVIHVVSYVHLLGLL